MVDKGCGSGHQASGPPRRWVERLDDLAGMPGFQGAGLEPAVERFPLLLNSYYLGLIKEAGDPIGRQVVPDRRELDDPASEPDPLNEEGQSPLPGLVHRYPDRVLLLVSNQCAVHCRFCMRKRKVSFGQTGLPEALKYISMNSGIKEVILSGGDPLMLSDHTLESILRRIRRIDHVEVIRIHTRVPCVWPQRVTGETARLLARFQPLYLMVHFNHPREITARSAEACSLLAAAGIPLGSQTVLLAGVNDDKKILAGLLRGLVRMRVRPYYLHLLDRLPGTAHFQVPLSRALEIMAGLRGHLSGLAVPQMMIDLPGGGGKVPLLPEYVVGRRPGVILLRNFQGRIFEYPCEQ